MITTPLQNSWHYKMSLKVTVGEQLVSVESVPAEHELRDIIQAKVEAKIGRDVSACTTTLTDCLLTLD